jgi:hypothetical protein
LDGVLREEELLENVVKKLYDLVGDTANFVVGYAKRGPAGTPYFSIIISINL